MHYTAVYRSVRSRVKLGDPGKPWIHCLIKSHQILSRTCSRPRQAEDPRSRRRDFSVSFYAGMNPDVRLTEEKVIRDVRPVVSSFDSHHRRHAVHERRSVNGRNHFTRWAIVAGDNMGPDDDGTNRRAHQSTPRATTTTPHGATDALSID
jgi:hypothetical protein